MFRLRTGAFIRLYKPELHNSTVTKQGDIIYIYIHTHIYIQVDSGGSFNTLGNDSMCDSKQKSSYEHGSYFQRLRSYDRLKLRIEGNDY